MFDHYRRLLAIRRRDIVPLLPRILGGACVAFDPGGAFAVDWRLRGDGVLHLLANLKELRGPVIGRPAGRMIFATHPGIRAALARNELAPWERHVAPRAILSFPVPDQERPNTPPAARIPRATYRVQLNAGFTFRDLTAIVPYLAALGVSHVYCSPYFRARAGSAHGYDVVDHNSFNPEIGSREDFELFVAELRAHAMGHILDIVPNHVGVMGSDNAWWMDVLENGQASVYADFFDIDWNPVECGPRRQGVGARARRALRNRARARRSQAAHSSASSAPSRSIITSIACRSIRAPTRASSMPCWRSSAMRELEKLRRLFGALPDRRGAAAEQIAERNRDKEAHKRALAELAAADAGVAAALEQALAGMAGKPGDPASFDPLHELLEAQAFRLAYWRVASDDINYRRFFDVNDLAALRVENEAVFEATHRLVLELIGSGALDGLRIDHADGLYDPLGYFRRLTGRIAQATAATGAGRRVYLVAEKITASFERLPADWPLHGETGYHFANVVNSAAGRHCQQGPHGPNLPILHRRAAPLAGRWRTTASFGCCASRSPPSSTQPRTYWRASRTATGLRATSRLPACGGRSRRSLPAFPSTGLT